jgi:hypothetical protein
MKIRPEDLVEVVLPIEEKTPIVVISPGEWSDAFAECYAQGDLLLEVGTDVHSRKRYLKAYQKPADPPPPEADVESAKAAPAKEKADATKKDEKHHSKK